MEDTTDFCDIRNFSFQILNGSFKYQRINFTIM